MQLYSIFETKNTVLSTFDRNENAIFIYKFQTGKMIVEKTVSNKKVNKTGSHKIFELPSFAAAAGAA